MNVALDTNVLVYAEGLNGAEKQHVALQVLGQLAPGATFIPVQVLGELLTVLVRKAGRSRADATTAVLGWGDAFPLIDTSPGVLLSAMNLVTAHQLTMWDATILAASADAGCRVLLSEDLQEGFTWSGVTVVNPFARPSHPLLSTVTAGQAAAIREPLQDPLAVARAPVVPASSPRRPRGPRTRR